jgi:flagella basal body P-ring formation protein FlgA
LLCSTHRQYGDDRHSNVTRLSTVLLAKALLLIAGAALAQSIQPLPAIQAAAERFVSSRLPKSQAKFYVEAGALDSRLRLAACASPLEVFAPSEATFSARTTVGVRCTTNSQWTLYVPVTIEVETQVLVLRRGLARRARIESTDVELQTRRLPGTLTNFISDALQLQGHRLKRALPAGTPLTADVLAPDVLIRRGQKVTLVAANGSIEIRAEGLALSEGGAADRVRVQNANSLKIVEGVVENASTVRVQL